MAVYALGDLVPVIDPTAWVHPDATIIGDVTLGAEVSVWPGAVLRGDFGPITIGPRTSIQDGTVVHTSAEYPTLVGAECVVGHLVHLEGCTIGSRVLVGSGSVVLHGARVGDGALVGAGAVVSGGIVVPPDHRALGVPARVRPGAGSKEAVDGAVPAYVENARRFREGLTRLS